MNLIGLGNIAAKINVYIENSPPLVQYQSLSVCRPLQIGEIKMIADLTGNHWRKIFNVYAKLVFELIPQDYETWQAFRDKALLQQHSNESLLFNLAPENVFEHFLSQHNVRKNISIIMGKTYATKLGLAQACHWLSDGFAVNTEKKLIICPYFDYRQLSNLKISTLCQLINSLTNTP